MLEYFRMSAMFPRLANVCGPPCRGARMSAKKPNSSSRMMAALQPETRRGHAARGWRLGAGDWEFRVAICKSMLFAKPQSLAPSPQPLSVRARDQCRQMRFAGVSPGDLSDRFPSPHRDDAIAQHEQFGQVARG